MPGPAGTIEADAAAKSAIVRAELCSVVKEAECFTPPASNSSVCHAYGLGGTNDCSGRCNDSTPQKRQKLLSAAFDWPQFEQMFVTSKI